VSSDLKISYPEEGFLSNDGRWAAFTVEKQAEDKTWHHFQQCWNCETGLLVRELPVEETIAGICPDGTMLVLEKARPNKTILRNPEDWKEIRVLDGTARDSPVLSPDGRYCITDDGKNTLLHSLTDQTVIRRLEGNKSYSQFSPDGKLLLTGWYFPKNPTLKWYDRMHNYDLRIWNAESGILVGSARLDDVLLWQPPVWISSRHVYAPIDPRHQWIWDTTASPPPFSDHYFQIRYSPDGNRFAQFDDRAIFKMGDTSIATPSVIVRTPAKVLNIVLSKIGDRVLTSHTDDKVRLWRQRRPEPWWGIAWLPESWLTLLFGGVLIWSLFRDRRENRRSA
jgi:hypothetical protein